VAAEVRSRGNARLQSGIIGVMQRMEVVGLVCLAIVGMALAGCGGGSGGSPSGPSAVDPGGPTGSTTARTYYVAINEAGADNERCDGSSPTNLGGGRCPFRDFRSGRTFSLVNNVANVRLEVRRGTYNFVNEGLSITGTGRSVDESVVLAGHNGEEVIFDGEERLNATLRVAGQYVTVTGITFIRGGGYNVELRGGRQVRILNNRFLSNRSSDSLKGTDGAADVEVRGNTFTQWDSQAIDVTNVSRWTIVDNLFHDASRGTGPLGAKAGSRDVRFTDNRIRNAGGLSMGGTSSSHSNAYEAYSIVAERNTFDHVIGHAAMFYSCLGCRFADNTVSTAERGVRLGGVLFLVRRRLPGLARHDGLAEPVPGVDGRSRSAVGRVLARRSRRSAGPVRDRECLLCQPRTTRAVRAGPVDSRLRAVDAGVPDRREFAGPDGGRCPLSGMVTARPSAARNEERRTKDEERDEERRTGNGTPGTENGERERGTRTPFPLFPRYVVPVLSSPFLVPFFVLRPSFFVLRLPSRPSVRA
jgi:Right handed beta helix region